MQIKTVTIIGANGTMGPNVSAIYASFGNAKVNLICRTLEKALEAIEKAVSSVRSDSIRANLIPADFSMLEECVSTSDLIIEHVKEDLELKKSIMNQIASFMKSTAIVGSGSSGLPITKLAECFSDNLRGHFFGIHMFNPPYSLTLCELIPTKYSDEHLLNELKEYLSSTLVRTVVEVKDSPAFLGNRIGFQFINEALQYAEKYKDNGGIDYIDAIIGPFTGRSMAPLITSDFVGLDVHKAIVDNLYKNTHDYSHESFVLPHYVETLIKEGKLGRKSNGGLYKLVRYDNGLKRMTVYDIASNTYRDQIKYVFPFVETMIVNIEDGSYQTAFKALVNNKSQEATICLEFLLKYIMYSLYTSKEVSKRVHAADDVMATGFNWCPPLAILEALSSVTDIKQLIKDRLNLTNIDVDYLFSTVEPSKYDYRLYFKAKR